MMLAAHKHTERTAPMTAVDTSKLVTSVLAIVESQTKDANEAACILKAAFAVVSPYEVAFCNGG